MTRALKLVGGGVGLMAVLVLGLYAYRSLMFWGGRTPEGYQLLTPMPGAAGFEPTSQPDGPVLESPQPGDSSGDLAVNFGYRVGGISYSYALALTFPPGSDKGRAVVTVHHANRSASRASDTVRRWDGPRKAYSVALTDGFDMDPQVPALCLKAVIGPSTASLDLDDASLCVAQRDATGQCHPATLACGLIRR